MSRKIMLVVFLVGCLTAVSAEAAIDDVLVWDTIRSQADLEGTLQNGYPTLGDAEYNDIRMWWDFNDPLYLDRDVGPHSYHLAGTSYPNDPPGVTNTWTSGNVTSLATDTPFTSYTEGGLAVSGFTTNDSRVVGDPQLWDWNFDGLGDGAGYYKDRTYEMWIRNPHLGGDAVFFSIQGLKDGAGGGDYDTKRMWVNDDGSMTMADRGSKTPQFQSFTTDSLTWEDNAWYQISVVFDYIANDYHDMRVYRGKKGDSQIELLLDYQSSSFNWSQWLAVGAHPEGYYSTGVGNGGHLGEDTYVPEPFTMVLLAAGGLMTLRKKRR